MEVYQPFVFLPFGPQRDKTCLQGFEKVRLKQVSSATQTIEKFEILLVASLDMILSKREKQRC